MFQAHLVPALPQLGISHFSVELWGMQSQTKIRELLECPFFLTFPADRARKQIYCVYIYKYTFKHIYMCTF